MNQKDYKAIAEILRNNVTFYQRQAIALQLADYFEKEEYSRLPRKDMHEFNKKQFLKDCGIENE